MKKQILISGLALIAGLSSSQAASSVPRACIEHAIMTSFAEVNVPSDMLARCDDPQGQPVRGGLKKIDKKLIDEITEEYNLLAECLDLNAGFYFSKISGESGFQVNTIGPDADGGIGQLTYKAIDGVNEQLSNYLYRIKTSSKKACQKVQALITKKLNGKVQAESDFKHRCQLINDQENPLRNLIYTMIYNDMNRRAVNNAYASHDITGKMAQVGVVLSQQDEESLKSFLAMMGYNIGGANAVKDVESYLAARLEFINKKSDQLPKINLMFDIKSYAMFIPSARDFLKMIDTNDVDVIAGIAKYKELRKPHLQELKDKLKNDDEAKKQFRAWFQTISASELSLSEWLWAWQASRGIAYVSMINTIKMRTDEQMGAGVCTSDHMDRD